MLVMKCSNSSSLIEENLGELSAIWRHLIPEIGGTRAAATTLEARLAGCHQLVSLFETEASREARIWGGQNEPLVSVIVPTYKAEATVIRALESLGEQTYKNKEIVIVDDGSSTQDRTVELIKAFMARENAILRIKLVPLPVNTGFPAASRNAALGKASGGVVTFLDDDDTLATKESLAKLMRPHVENKNVIASIGDYLVCDSEGRRTKKGNARWPEGTHPTINWARLFLMDTMLSSIAVKKNLARCPYIKLHEDMGPYFEAFNEAARRQYGIKEADLVNSIVLVPEPIYKYCQRDGSVFTCKTISSLERFQHVHAALTYAFNLPSIGLIPGGQGYMKARYTKDLIPALTRARASSSEDVAALRGMVNAAWLNEPFEDIEANSPRPTRKKIFTQLRKKVRSVISNKVKERIRRIFQ